MSEYSDYKTTTLPDEAATLALGKCMARGLVPGLVIYLHGDLGAGKTALTRALLHAAGHQGNVKSPTYTLAEPYQIHINNQSVKVMHFDLYRMIDAEEFSDAGFREEFNDETICIVEWPEKGDGVLPTPDLNITLTVAGTGRLARLQALSGKGHSYLTNLHFAPAL